ncbi:hypothetical protein N657DRAFT_649024 [Parathielavia appendiculata]|uniref:Uncharacterized protein n=1 Tax=Parathielavia appendiculata TaxID=2587402 RepID=A0AAN6TTM5_9PEZI|nr:hypothetical protein N657DRAFT_649024 [Parathielavia appendiculata]
MKYLTTLASALGLMASVSAVPIEERDDVQTVHLTFHGGPAQYTMAIPADGTVYPTNNDLSINLIEAPDYNAFSQCKFQTLNQVALASSISPGGVNQILVGPPSPVTGVSCQGMCVHTYGECFRNGQYVGPCCSGFCAANRCRPWVNPS